MPGEDGPYCPFLITYDKVVYGLDPDDFTVARYELNEEKCIWGEPWKLESDISYFNGKPKLAAVYKKQDSEFLFVITN